MSDTENEPIANKDEDEEMQEPGPRPVGDATDDAGAGAAPAAAPTAPTEPTAEADGGVAAAADSAAPRGDAQVDSEGNLADATFAEGEDIRLAGTVSYATYGSDLHPPFDVTEQVRVHEKKGYTIFSGGFVDFLDAKGPQPPGANHKFRVWYKAGSVEERKKNDIFAGGQSFKPKSLFLALTFNNPFFACREELPDGTTKLKKPPHQPDQLPVGYPATEYSPATNMQDDDFLATKGPFGSGGNAPNHFQKMIELLLRMKSRHLTVLPPDVLVEADAPPEDMPWNHFAGHSLKEISMFLSPDKDECYFQVHAKRDVLLDFAAHQGLTLQTNKYSHAGGAGMIYTNELSEELTQSVRDYMRHFEIPEEDHYCRGKLLDLPPEEADDEEELGADGKPDGGDDEKKTDDSVDMEPNTIIVDGKRRRFAGWAFLVEVPQKQRLLLRLLREGWQYGGAGLQLDEMREKDPEFLKNYFVMHNDTYKEAYDIDKWGGLSALCCNPCLSCQDWEQPVTHYFGESVALYFSWARRYVAFLSVPAVVGVACGIAMELTDYPAAIGGGFAIFLMLWGVLWLRSWQRHEQRFCLRWGQQIEKQTELARDEFEPDDKRHFDVQRLFGLDFEYPLTMQRLPNGTMVELYFPSLKRNCRRYGLAYPLLLLLASAMVGCLFFIEFYRVTHKEDQRVAIGASILATITIQIFNKLSAVLIDALNDFENPRTTSEKEDELIMKSFAFTFVSTYFSVGALLFWPGIPNDVRRNQLKTQMIVQQCVMPAVLNIVELLLPRVMSSLQRRVDVTGGYCTAICSYCCCCGCCDCCDACAYEGMKVKPKNERDEVGANLWKQAQMQVYDSTAGDYLEVVLLFGYQMIFASIFPWAGLAGFINMIVETRVDAHKLTTMYQRPVARITTGIGAYADIQFILLGIAICCNVYFVTMIAEAPKELGMGFTHKDNLEAFGFLQYFVVLAVLVIGLIRSPTSPSVKKMETKINLLSDRSIQNYVRKMLAMSPKALKKHGEDAEKEINLTEKEDGCPCC